MRRQASHSPAELDDLAKDVLRLSHLLTRDRDDLPSAYLRDPGLRDAYLHYYLPANVAKIHLPLAELSRHPAGLLQRSRLRVLDLGTGPGTSVLGILEFFAAEKQPPSLEFTAVDQVAENLHLAGELFREESSTYRGKAELRTVKRPIAARMDACEGTYDIIVFSNVLNELFHAKDGRIEARTQLVAAILDRMLAQDGACIIIEPALRDTTREMLQVRDGLVERGLPVYSPCLMQENCPALVNPKDWCHEDIPWLLPDLLREIDRRTGLRKDSLKFSYLVLRRDERRLADCSDDGAFRVVSEPLVSKGKKELYLCGRGGRRISMRQDKDRSAANAAFDELQRGAVARFEGLLSDEKRLRAVRDTKVSTIAFPGGAGRKEGGT
jgi:ribosomal protein RSM22 (predicted rRNA methylase)